MNDDLLDRLERLLADARAGRVTSLTAAIGRTDGVSVLAIGAEMTLCEHVGRLHLAAASLTRDALDECDEVEADDELPARPTATDLPS